VSADPTTPNVTRSPIDGTVCVGQTLTVTAPTSTGGAGTCNFEYQFSTNGGTTYSGWSTTVPSFAATGTDNRIQTRRNCNGSGCDISGINTQIWTVVADPTVSITGNQTICSGGAITLGTSVSGGTGTCSLQWQVWNGTVWINAPGVSTGNTYTTPALTTPTQYQVVRTCTGLGCGSVTSASITVDVVADPAISITTGNQTICSGGVITLNTSTSGGTGTCSYQWQAWNGSAFVNIPGAINDSYTTPALLATSLYQVIRTCSGGGCTNAVAPVVTITIAADPTPPNVTKNPTLFKYVQVKI
jgi:hypothetical protein